MNKEQTSSKLGKMYVKAVYCNSAYLSYMQSTSCKMPGWMKDAENKYMDKPRGEGVGGMGRLGLKRVHY